MRKRGGGEHRIVVLEMFSPTTVHTFSVNLPGKGRFCYCKLNGSTVLMLMSPGGTLSPCKKNELFSFRETS